MNREITCYTSTGEPVWTVEKQMGNKLMRFDSEGRAAFAAQYDDTCLSCGCAIKKGYHRLHWVKTPVKGAKAKRYHFDCAEKLGLLLAGKDNHSPVIDSPVHD